jgi:hypothetical protein
MAASAIVFTSHCSIPCPQPPLGLLTLFTGLAATHPKIGAVQTLHYVGKFFCHVEMSDNCLPAAAKMLKRLREDVARLRE